MTRLTRNKISPLLWTLVWRPRSIWRKQGSRSWMTNWDKRLSPPPTSDIRNCFRISEVCIERIGIRRWTERDRKICPFFFLRNWTNIVTDDEIRNRDTHSHDHRCKHDPANIPEVVQPYTHHLMYAIAEFFRSEYPRYSDRLEKTDPENRHSAGRVEIH